MEASPSHRCQYALISLLLASGTALAQQAPEFRTFNGTGNNPSHPTWGSAGTAYLRETSGAHYADGHSAPAGGTRPSARFISNAIADQGSVEEPDERGLATTFYEFGQFLDHDIGLAAGGTVAFNILVPMADPQFDPFHTGHEIIGMNRSASLAGTGITNARQQINTVTSFIDGSQIYGSDPVRAAWLRTFTGGHLRTQTTPIGIMMPLNDGTMANDNPVGAPVTSLYVAGDVRANEQPGLITFHTVFLREHNWQADRLHALHPTWNDERLYQEARQIIGAELQVIVTREFLPAVLGRGLPPYTGYKQSVNPGLSNAFAAAAYRVGHSMVGPDIDLLNSNWKNFGVLELAESFFNPATISIAGGIEPIVRYFVTDHQQRTDTMVVDPLRNFLFGPPGAGGFDLAALNIQRGRDHGLADYNTVRQDYGLSRVQSFSQITSDPALAQTLLNVYGSVNNIDPWVGMLAEDHAPGASVGRTHTAIFLDQFARLRDGDWFWYRNCNMSQGDIDAIEGTHLTDIFRRATGITQLQANVFFAMDPPVVGACYANCDGSTGTPVLSANDFQCFLMAFAAGSPTANCDQSTGTPMLTANDFQCFISAYSTGCP